MAGIKARTGLAVEPKTFIKTWSHYRKESSLNGTVIKGIQINTAILSIQKMEKL